jgi:DNA-binding transcriptional LysR family regulator
LDVPKAELLSLQQVRCVCSALELGSFTAAARALGVTQPAVADQVRKLEDTLGTDLFVRVGRGVVATDAGRAFAEHATRGLAAFDDAVTSVDEAGQLQVGTIAIGIFGEPSAWRVDELVIDFLKRHPALRVRLVGLNSTVIAERVRRGVLEAGLVALPINDDGLDVRPLIRDETLYISANPANTRVPVTIERLAALTLIFYDAESGDHDPFRRRLVERAQALGIHLVPKVEVETKDSALRLAAAGIGDTYLPRAFTRAAYYPDGLTTTSFSPALHDTIAIVTKAGRRTSAAMRLFLADLEPHIHEIAERLHPDSDAVP